MNSRLFLNKWLMIICVGLSVAAFAGCAKDYDDDIKNLNEKVDGNHDNIAGELAAQRTALENAMAAADALLKTELTDAYKAEIQTAKEALEMVNKQLQGDLEELKKEIFGDASIGDQTLKQYIDAEIGLIQEHIAQTLGVKVDELFGITGKLEGRIASLETLYKYLQGEPAGTGWMNDIEDAQDDLNDRLDDANAALKKAQDRLAAVEDEIDPSNPDGELSKLKKELEGEISDLNTLVGGLTTSLETLQNTVDALPGEMDDKMAALKTELESQLAAAEQDAKEYADAQLDKFVADGAFLDALKNTLPDAITAALGEGVTLEGIYAEVQRINTINDQLYNLSQTVSQNYTELGGKIATIDGQLEPLNNMLEAYADSGFDFANVVSQLSDLQNNIEEALTADEIADCPIAVEVPDEIKALFPDNLDENGNLVLCVEDHMSTIYKKVVENSAAIGKAMGEIAAANGKIADLEEKLGELSEAHTTQIVQILTTLNEWITTTEPTTSGHLKSLNQIIKDAIAENTESSLSALETQLQTVSENVETLSASVDQIAEDLEALTAKVEEIESSLDDYATDTELSETKQALENQIQITNLNIVQFVLGKDMSEDIKALGGIPSYNYALTLPGMLDKFGSELISEHLSSDEFKNAVKSAMNDGIGQLQNSIDGLTAEVGKLQNRVQSFVFDSKYSVDMAVAEVKAFNGQPLGDMVFPFEFTVSPASAAARVTADKLSFEFNEVMVVTRSAAGPTMTASNVTTDPTTGKVTFDATLKDFDPNYFTAGNTMAYRVKVRFSDKDGNGEDLLSTPILLSTNTTDVEVPTFTFATGGTEITTGSNFIYSERATWTTSSVVIPTTEWKLPSEGVAMPAFTVSANGTAIDTNNLLFDMFGPDDITFEYALKAHYRWYNKGVAGQRANENLHDDGCVSFADGKIIPANADTTFGNMNGQPDQPNDDNHRLIVTMTMKAGEVVLNTADFVISFEAE